jgi:spore coat protein U-like protein
VRLRLVSLFAAGLLALAAPARLLAGAGCSVSVVGVNFGLYDPLALGPADSAGRVEVTCDYLPPGGATGVSYDVALSAGTSGSFLQRYMALGTARLPYNLYTDAARSLVWGNGSAGSGFVSGGMKVNPGAHSSLTNSHTVYGRIPAGVDAALGSFSDSIVVTLTF